MKRAEWNVRIVSWPATPGATTFRPPDQPAMKCGSTRPVAIFRSASTKRLSMLDRRAARRGRPEVDVVRIVAGEVVFDPDVLQHPRIADQLRELGALVGAVQAGGHQDRDAASSGMPAAAMVSIIGRRNRWFGTGRVMSQIRMQALSAPLRQLAKRLGVHRVVERVIDGGARVRKDRQRRLADNGWFATIRHGDRQQPSAVRDFNPARRHRAGPGDRQPSIA